MAQNIILKRSSLPGKVPDTGSLNVGEIAVNTYDGKIFIKRSGNLDSIEGIVVTNSITTGSISLTRTGSFGELIIAQDANITRDLYVTNDIIGAGDIDISGDITGSSALLSGSLILSGSQTITNNLTVLGEVNARQFNISVISSSVLFQSGSTKFGDTSDDIHSFTGSVNVTGSLYLNGQEVGSGTTSGSFTGSFTGDGSGLRGVVSDDLPIDGWDYNSNSSASISEFNNESRKYLIDFQWEEEVGTPIGFKTFISNVTGSSQIVPTEEGIKFIVGNQQVALVGPNGIESVAPAGTVSGSSQLTSSYDTRYAISGSVGAGTSDFTQLTNVPSGLVSGSSQLTGSYDTRYALSGSVGSTFIRKIETYTATEGQTIFPTTASVEVDNVDVYINGFKLLTSDFSVTNSNTITLTTGSSLGEQVEINLYSAFFGTYLTTEDLNAVTASFSTASLVSSITSLSSLTSSYATTGSNTFVGTQTFSGSLIPSTDNTYDLGSPTKQFRDLYLSSASLYIDGTKVLGSTAQELTITTDEGQSIKILEAGSDSIILQSADGDIELKSSGGGDILLDPTSGLISVKGTLQIQDGNKITSSGGNSIQFGNDLGITGSISTTGNINGINLASFSSSLSTQNSRLTSLETKSGSVDSSISNVNSFTSSNGNTSLNTYTSSLNTALSVSGQNVTVNGNFTVAGTQTIVDSTTVQIGDNIIELNGSGATNAGLLVKDATAPNTVSGSLLWDSTNDYWKGGALGSESKLLLANGDNVVSGSSQVVGILSSLNTYTGSNDTTNTAQNSRLTSIESATGSYETKGRGIVSGSSQITLSSTTGYGSVINQAVLTTSSPTFAGGTFSGGVQINQSASEIQQIINSNATTKPSITQYRVNNSSGWEVGMANVSNSYSYLFSYGEFGPANSKFTLTSAGAATFASSVTANRFNVNGVGNAIAFDTTNSAQTVLLSTKNDFEFSISNQRGTSSEIIVGNSNVDLRTSGEVRLRVTPTGTVQPGGNGTQDLGSAANAWRNIYTNDLHLSNEGKPEGNDIDGTTGNWTIQEGEEHLYIINNKTGKKFKFSLEEIQ